MRYLVPDDEGVISMDAYFAYLHSIKSHLPPDLYSFAADPERYDLHSKRSLHDAWLQELRLVPMKADAGRLVLELSLLGAYHDRTHVLKYDGVSRFLVTNSPDRTDAPADLLVHEIRVAGREIVHELAFDRGLTIEIACEQMQHREVPSN